MRFWYGDLLQHPARDLALDFLILDDLHALRHSVLLLFYDICLYTSPRPWIVDYGIIGWIDNGMDGIDGNREIDYRYLLSNE